MFKKFAIVGFSTLLTVGLVACGDKKQTKQNNSHVDPMRGQATGYATIYDNDTALARDRAKDNAKNNLVKTKLGSTVSGQSMVKNYQLVASIVNSRSYGLVKDIKIIKQIKEGNSFSVTIEGTVEPAAIQDAIEDALNRYGKPKFMVLVTETQDGKKIKPGFTETELVIQEVMGNSGFEFIDPTITAALMKKNNRLMRKAIQGNIDGAVTKFLVNESGAEVIIIGSTITRDQSKVMRQYTKDMKSKSAMVKIKAIDVNTGSILAIGNKQAPGIHIESRTAAKVAITTALKRILGKTDYDTGKFKTGPFLNRIVKKFVKAATNRQILLSINGLSYSDTTKFRNQISQRVRGVNQVISKKQKRNSANLEIYFAGKTTDFTDELMAKSKDLGFKIRINDVRPNNVKITARRVK